MKTGLGEVMIELPWSDEPTNSWEPTFEDSIEEFEFSIDAMQYICGLLSEENSVVIEHSMHLLEETAGVYRIQYHGNESFYNSPHIITLTSTQRGGKVVFDSELEKCFKLSGSFKQYLTQRDTLSLALKNI